MLYYQRTGYSAFTTKAPFESGCPIVIPKSGFTQPVSPCGSFAATKKSSLPGFFAAFCSFYFDLMKVKIYKTYQQF
jgi:hypothetical protein